MHSPGNSWDVADQQWLLDACSKEIRAHRLIFLVVLCPLLAYWLPSLMLNIGLAVGIRAWASSVHAEEASERWLVVVRSAAFILPIAPLALGAWREHRRQKLDEQRASGGMVMPASQGAMLADRIAKIWNLLGAAAGRTLPGVICQPNFRVLAHAYDDGREQSIEVSAGLASRVVRDDPMALSILRHEMAHLVYGDLPAIRRQSIVTAAAILAIDASLATCLAAALVIVGLTDAGDFPVTPTFVNIVTVHAGIALATLNVTLPLLLGRYAIRRYAGFCVALAEMRADVAAGIWGDGLAAFSHRLKSDPTVAALSLEDVGLAYLSSSLSHFPAKERAALLADPERLATPKLRYFAIAIVAIWLLAFHQGHQIWDAGLLSMAVAFLQAITLVMVLNAGRHAVGTAWRAATLALGVLLVQALPLISIEGFVYLTQHLTAALVVTGGFGNAGDADYWRDTIETFQDFGRFVVEATGGTGFPLALAIVTAVFWLGQRSVARLQPGTARLAALSASMLTAAASLAVSYRFFQEDLSRILRDLAFRWSPNDADAELVSQEFLQATISRTLYMLGEALSGTQILEGKAWLRLALPNIMGLAVILIVCLFKLSSARAALTR